MHNEMKSDFTYLDDIVKGIVNIISKIPKEMQKAQILGHGKLKNDINNLTLLKELKTEIGKKGLNT
tara:strand:+ start:22449 stop:22646 length:198 start_codon:yes stop_codon:yes gene_type:complete